MAKFVSQVLLKFKVELASFKSHGLRLSKELSFKKKKKDKVLLPNKREMVVG